MYQWGHCWECVRVLHHELVLKRENTVWHRSTKDATWETLTYELKDQSAILYDAMSCTSSYIVLTSRQHGERAKVATRYAVTCEMALRTKSVNDNAHRVALREKGIAPRHFGCRNNSESDERTGQVSASCDMTDRPLSCTSVFVPASMKTRERLDSECKREDMT